MNPYEADPKKIPENDMYVAEPFYGRYFPHPDDFKPDEKYINSTTTTPESIEYWRTVLAKCNESNRVYDNQDGGRSVFAVGSVIIKTMHLHHDLEGKSSGRDYTFPDANEVKVTEFVRKLYPDGEVQIPYILFAGRIGDLPTLIQTRISGVGLNVAWKYLSAAQKTSFKSQARDFLLRVHALKPTSSNPRPSLISPDPDPVAHRGIQELERQLLYDNVEVNEDLGLVHNDLQPSNIIVNNDKIVGVIDWEMAGYFGLKRAAEVHVKIRSPTREMYEHLGLGEERLADILYWNDLYGGV